MKFKCFKPIIASALAVAGGVCVASAAMPGGSTIYGGLWSSHQEGAIYGIYDLSADGQTLMLADPKGAFVGYPLTSAWLEGDKLCGYYVVEYYSVVEAMYYIECDFATGEVTRWDELPTDRGYMFCSAYNPDDRHVYGYGLTADFSYALLKAPCDDPGNLQSVREFDYTADEECLAIAYNTQDQRLYGINAKGKFVTVNPNTGLQTVICNVPVSDAGMVSGMCYAPLEDLFYWNPQIGDYDSSIYTVSTDGAEFAKVFDCPNGEQYNFFICPDRLTTALSPKAAVIKSVDFPNGALSGIVTITMPTESVDGANLSGTLEWEAIFDGAGHEMGEAAPGADVIIAFNNLSEGKHIFTFKVYCGENESENASVATWIGTDTPLAPTGVTLSHEIVEWKGVNGGVNSGYVDLDNLRYDLYINDVKTATVNHLACDYIHNLGERDVERFTVKVVAVAGGKSSAEALSNEAALGRPVQPDFTLIPTREDVDRMTVVDANGDGRTWSYSLYQECAKSSFGSGRPMDDWLITSPILLTVNTEYSLGFDVRNCSSTYTDEHLRVCIGRSPQADAMTLELIPTFTPTRSEATFTKDFEVAETGVYYIGFHNNSDPDMEGILLSNITLHPKSQDSLDRLETDNKASSDTGAYYTVDGRLLPGLPTTPGLYLLRTSTTTSVLAIK